MDGMKSNRKKRFYYWYDALVKNSSGVHRAFCACTKPVIGNECPGIAAPNRIVGFVKYRAFRA